MVIFQVHSSHLWPVTAVLNCAVYRTSPSQYVLLDSPVLEQGWKIVIFPVSSD